MELLIFHSDFRRIDSRCAFRDEFFVEKREGVSQGDLIYLVFSFNVINTPGFALKGFFQYSFDDSNDSLFVVDSPSLPSSTIRCTSSYVVRSYVTIKYVK